MTYEPSTFPKSWDAAKDQREMESRLSKIEARIMTLEEHAKADRRRAKSKEPNVR